MAPVTTMTKVRWMGPTAEDKVRGAGRSGETAAATLESPDDEAQSQGGREQTRRRRRVVRSVVLWTRRWRYRVRSVPLDIISQPVVEVRAS